MLYKNEFSEDAAESLKALGLSESQITAFVYHGDFNADEDLSRELVELRGTFDAALEDFEYSRVSGLRKIREDYEKQVKPLEDELEKIMEKRDKLAQRITELEMVANEIAEAYKEVTGEDMPVDVEKMSEEEWKNANKGWM